MINPGSHTMPVVTMRQLLEAGVHFGHQTRRWNPKMKRFIFGERNGIYIIDLQQSLLRIDEAYQFVRDLTARGGTILFIATKKQAQEPVRKHATRCGMPYINERWLGGMLTNFTTMHGRVAKMRELERQERSGEFDAMPKKEALRNRRELIKLQRYLAGIVGLDRAPNAVFIVDTKKEHIAVTEANKLGLPVVAVVDTNCDPDLVEYVIPGNDDAIRSAELMCRIIADAVDEGRRIAAARDPRPVVAAGGGATAEATVAPAPRQLDPEEARRRAAEQARAKAEAAAAQRAREERLLASQEAAKEAREAAKQAAAEAPAAGEAPATVEAPAAAEVVATVADGGADEPVSAAEPAAEAAAGPESE
jgi:small subunit ribosomal protein S2